MARRPKPPKPPRWRFAPAGKAAAVARAFPAALLPDPTAWVESFLEPAFPPSPTTAWVGPFFAA